MAALWDSCAVMAYMCHSGGGYLGVLALFVIPYGLLWCSGYLGDFCVCYIGEVDYLWYSITVVVVCLRDSDEGYYGVVVALWNSC